MSALPAAGAGAPSGSGATAVDAGARQLVSRSTRVAAPPDAVAVFAAAVQDGEPAAFITRPAEGACLVAIGRAWGIAPDGPGRFLAADAAWRELLDSARLDAPATAGAGPVLVGGLGFSGRRPDAADVWEPFGASSLVLPRRSLAAMPDGWWQTTNALGRPDAGTVRHRDPTPPIDGAHRAVDLPPLDVVSSHPDVATWERMVGVLSGAVGRGRLDKVVLARRVVLEASVRLDLAAALRRLITAAPELTVYAFHRAGRTFLGATPERLARTQGRRFWSQAVAGTIARGGDAVEDAVLAARVMASEKEREEHAVVVGALRERLAPLATDVRFAVGPRVLALRDVQHLVTDVEGTLADGVGLLGLADRLHPTPAVGGEPRDLALALIDEYEGFDRGWYAGPVGWLGADGDGELSVALRCAVVDGRRATLFAGCGIVADSDPDQEWAEASFKLRAAARALGRPPDDL